MRMTKMIQKKSKRSNKQQIRSLERLLRKLPQGSEKRTAIEGQLKNVMEKRKDAMQRIRERKFAKRYKGIRFLEAQKLRRQVKKAESALRESETKKEKLALEKTIKRLKEDLVYVKNFPNGEKYISVLKKSTAESEVVKERIRSEIAERLKEQAIVTEADEGLAAGSLPQKDSEIEAGDDFFLNDEVEEVDEDTHKPEKTLIDPDLLPVIEEPRQERARNGTVKQRKLGNKIQEKVRVKERDFKPKRERFSSGKERQIKDSIKKQRFEEAPKSPLEEKNVQKPRTRSEGGRKRRRKKS